MDVAAEVGPVVTVAEGTAVALAPGEPDTVGEGLIGSSVGTGSTDSLAEAVGDAPSAVGFGAVLPQAVSASTATTTARARFTFGMLGERPAASRPKCQHAHMALFKRRKAEKASEAEAPPVGPSPFDVLAAQTIARHFDDGTADGRTARLGFNDVTIDVWVQQPNAFGANHVAVPMFLNVSGGRLGKVPSFASLSGYGDTPEEAIIAGMCEWSCTFGPVLRRGLTDELVDASEAREFTTELDGTRFRTTVDSYGRVIGSSAGGAEDLERVQQSLAGDEPLTKTVVESGLLPVLPTTSSTLLSVFVMESTTSRTVEVKVNGADWWATAAAFPQPSAVADGRIVMIRELAVVVPQSPELRVPTREALARTLKELGTRTEPATAAGWRGWRVHGGALGQPMTKAALRAVEASTGPLDEGHRAFLTTVAADGAGPGYGLLAPQRVEDVIPLAHAGCGVTWVLRLDDAHRGEVWVDAAGSDGSFAPVASSFLGWYLAWLDSAVRNATPWLAWDFQACASVSVLSQFLEANPGTRDLSSQVGPDAVALAGGGKYLPAGSALDPCHGCTEVFSRFGLPDDRFQAGSLSRAL